MQEGAGSETVSHTAQEAEKFLRSSQISHGAQERVWGLPRCCEQQKEKLTGWSSGREATGQEKQAPQSFGATKLGPTEAKAEFGQHGGC